MKFKRRFSQRVFLSLAILSFALISGAAALSLVIAYVAEDSVIENLLIDEQRYIESQFQVNNRLPTPRVDFIHYYQSLNAMPAVVAERLKNNPYESEIGDAGEYYHVRILYLDGQEQAYMVARVDHLLAVSGLSSTMFFLFFAAFCLALCLAFVTSLRLARRTTAPILNLSQRVLRLRGEEQNQKIYRDEIHYLEESVDFSFGQLEKLLQREAAFNHDLSHEIRSDLTVLSNELELAQRDAFVKPQLLPNLREKVKSMSELVELLLLLARQESSAQQSFDLRAVVEAQVLERLAMFESAGFELDLSLEACEVVGHPRLAAMVIDNLLRNALAHASTPKLSVRLDTDGFSIENDASSVPENPLQSGQKGRLSQGQGQGLYLVKRILDTMGWAYQAQHEQGLFRFSIQP